MFSRVAARICAVTLALSLAIFGGSTTALAQYQADWFTPDAPPVLQELVAQPFGLDTSPVTSGEILAKWSGVVADIGVESDILTRCREDAHSCPAAAQKFLAMIDEGRSRDGRARFGVINRAVNLAIRPESDLVQWGVPDRWTAPLITLATGRGDCEDYAIAKYVALQEAGVSERDLRVVIVRDLVTAEDHAVVAARFEQKWLVLDNRRLVLLEDIEMPQVVPLFVLERDSVRQFAPAATLAARDTTAASGTTAAPSSLGF